jgi:hypothetical protein
MSLKKSCSFISSAPLAPAPILLCGFLFSKLVSRDFADFERELGSLSAAF